ncbi:MAG: hypothetical protein WD750_05535 [Gammaproteobacteria bacterium]
MNVVRIVAILLIIGGALGLAYGGFSYTKETHETDLGPIQLSVDEKEYISVPIWAGIGLITVGGILLVVGWKGR